MSDIRDQVILSSAWLLWQSDAMRTENFHEAFEESRQSWLQKDDWLDSDQPWSLSAEAGLAPLFPLLTN